MHKLRMKLVRLSVVYAGSIGVFCLVAPIFGYPIDFPSESIIVVKQLLPIFIGFLAAGANYFTQGYSEETDESVSAVRLKGLNTIVNLSFWLFTVLTVALFFAFGYSGSRWAQPGQGMSIDDLTLLLAILLSVMTGTVGIIVTFVFRTGRVRN